MRCISLFAGIAGFDIAAEAVGWKTVAFVEWEEFPTMVLKKRFKNAEFYGDIDKFETEKYIGSIDIIFGGFPCQPFSVAGNQVGTDDPRYKWPAMLRVIREVGPRWVVAENVPGLLSWNNGLVLDTVLSDLEAEGYETLPPFVLPACATNAPHRRDRVWIIARNKLGNLHAGVYESSITPDPEGDGMSGRCAESERKEQNEAVRKNIQFEFERHGFQRATANAYIGIGRKRRMYEKRSKTTKRHFGSFNIGANWENFPTQPPICDGNDGISARLVRYLLRSGGDLYTEETATIEAKRIISKVRKEAIKAGGNAVVHQVVERIFKTINHIENLEL